MYGDAACDTLGRSRSAIEEGRPVVALESTLIAHGLPRPENVEIAREIEAAVRDEGAIPATIAVVDGDGPDRPGPPGARGDRRERRRQVQRARPAGRDGAARDRRDDRRRHRDARRARRDRRVRHRRHRRRAPRGARELGRVGRPDHARPDADHGRLRGREVDPRRRGHARAARDAERDAARLPDRSLPRLLPRRLRLPGAVARGHAAGGRRRRARARRARARARSSSPTRSTSRSTRTCTSACCRGPRGGGREGVRGKDVTPFLLDHFHRETHGASLAANVRLVLRNAALAAQIARATA